ncbi:MAG: exonuclease domain-containing protein [Brumimicrobium sp.]
MLYAVTDLETTGGSTKSTKITEIAIYLTNGEEIIDEFSTLINPECSIPAFITRLTGINDEMVRDAPLFYEVAKDIIEFVGDSVFVAHNIGFDYNVLRSEYRSLGFDFRKEHLCTVRSSRYLIPGQASYSLGKLANALNIEVENRHRAAGDALATVKLFHMLFQINPQGLESFIQKDIQPKSLHPGLDINTIENLPHKTGVYKFYNSENSLIYIGKSKNIRNRVMQHLKNNTSKKGIQMREEIVRVEFELTGSEMIALLIESMLIKKQKPRYNRALRKDKYPFGLYSFEDGKGYLNLFIDRVKNKSIDPHTTFSTKLEANQYLENNSEKHQLCKKLMGLYPTKNACFQYHIKQCKGACIGQEAPFEYNKRVNQLLQEMDFNMDSFFIVDKGRDRNEISLILIENGSYKGHGYLPSNANDKSIETWKEVIDYYTEDKDSKVIIKRLIRINKSLKVRRF